MKLYGAWFAVAVLGLTGGAASAQQPATAVQLPTYSFFSTATTVSVPDRGSAYLGGIGRAATGRNEFGVPLLPFRPFRNSAIGTERSVSNAHVTATIHDFAAMDEYLLSQPTGFSTPAAMLGHSQQPRRPAAGAIWQEPPAAAEQPTMSVAEAQALRLQQQQARWAEAAGFFERGLQAEAEGKANVAKIYFQMAARRADGDLKEQVLAKLDAIGRAQTGAQVAGSRP